MMPIHQLREMNPTVKQIRDLVEEWYLGKIGWLTLEDKIEEIILGEEQ